MSVQGQAWRVKRKRWSNVNELADELFVILTNLDAARLTGGGLSTPTVGSSSGSNAPIVVSSVRYTGANLTSSEISYANITFEAKRSSIAMVMWDYSLYAADTGVDSYVQFEIKVGNPANPTGGTTIKKFSVDLTRGSVTTVARRRSGSSLAFFVATPGFHTVFVTAVETGAVTTPTELAGTTSGEYGGGAALTAFVFDDTGTINEQPAVTQPPFYVA